MKRNVGTADRVLRVLGGVGLFVYAFMAPLPWMIRLFGLGGVALYLLASALAGTCLGYRMMGLSTCPTR